MDSVFFADILKESLAERGCAPLPGLGMLTMEVVPAYFSDRGFTINPPYQKIVFNQENNEDDFLVRRYAEDNGVSVARASVIVAEHVASLEKELRLSRTVSLPGLGCLRMTHDSNVFFVAGEGLSFGLAYDMLEPVSLRNLPALSSTTNPVVPAAQSEPTSSDSVVPSGPTAQSEPTPSEPAAQSEPDVSVVSTAPAEPVVLVAPAPIADLSKAVMRTGESEIPGFDTAKKKSAAWLMASLVIAGIVLLFFAALALCGRLYPDIVDSLLYSEEELLIIRTVL